MAAGHGDAAEIIGLEDTVAATTGEEVAQRLLRPFQLFARQAVSGGIVLFLFTLVALVWANSPWRSWAPAFPTRSRSSWWPLPSPTTWARCW